MRRGGATALVGAALAVASVGGAFAHEGAAPLVVEPVQVNPGGTVVLRTDSAGTDAEVTFFLAAEAGSVLLASGISDGAGHLSLAARIPGDVSPGTYEISATSGGQPIAEAIILIEGPTIADGEDPGAPREQEEPLLVPVPRAVGVPASANPAPAATTAGVSDPSDTGRGGDANPTVALILLVTLAVFGGSGLLFVRRRSR